MSKVEVTVYKTDGNQEVCLLEKSNLLSELQRLVGGSIERVPLFGRDDESLIINEEGLLLNLPPNPFAPFLFAGAFVGTGVKIKNSDFE